MGKKLDLTGQIFGRLTVIKEVDPYVSPKGNKSRRWLCNCKCGKETTPHQTSLRKGGTVSCGCYSNDILVERSTTHGMKHSLEYGTWQSMKDRCFNPNNESFVHYGDRNITVCPEWINSFEQFYKDMGPKPKGATIDRIDENGNYEPSNCRWTTSYSVQNINKRILKSNSSGHTGVYKNSSGNWSPRISVKGKTISLGTFSTKEEAIQARKEAEKKYHRPLLLQGIKTWKQLIDLYKT